MDKQKVEKVLKKNRYINATFARHFISAFNIWNTLLAPIIIGVGVSYLFQYKDNPDGINNLFFVLCGAFII
ncbi:GAF domain-containing protein, partial [Klebsiella pneumoniae]|nr:GAF domain-containing protein [Klebsiella pneumoniae]